MALNRIGASQTDEMSSMAQSVDQPASIVVRPGVRRVLLWHWGRAGAGSKFTYELVRALKSVPGILPFLAAAEGSELAALAQSIPDVPLWAMQTFRGDKTTWAGKLAAARGLFGLPRLKRQFQRALRESSADVAICTMQSIWDAATLALLRRRVKRFIFVLHDAKLHPGDWYPFRQLVIRREVEAADALIVLSDHVGLEAHRIYNFPRDRIWTVPHGSFTYGAGAVTPRAFPRERPLRLLFLGRIVAYKGLGHLLDAYRILVERGVRVELDIVGSGDLGPHAAQMEGLPGISVVNKWVNDDEIANALARGDVAVLPYVEASQSGVAATALTAGLPIVATPVGGLVEQVSDGRTGVIAKGMAASDLADAIARFANDAEFYESCSANALRTSQESLGWESIAERVGQIVQEVLARPERCNERCLPA
ncbi:glycosyltransferase family 4 protein [Microvirga flavescens]|uniref:glycosyltransferase family 4 protein n=1 Tax=Microvirga flavescens TaxID=2249811 RepID=UPI0018E0A30D|nr:glycosyltransferase family 4 protein [Microvirga flavescens]